MPERQKRVGTEAIIADTEEERNVVEVLLHQIKYPHSDARWDNPHRAQPINNEAQVAKIIPIARRAAEASLAATVELPERQAQKAS